MKTPFAAKGSGALVLRVLVIAASTLLWTPYVHSQSSQDVEILRKELEALKEGQAVIRRDLEELRNLLRGRQAAARPPEPLNLVLAVNGAPFLGEKNAPLTLIEFSDFQCPYCARHVRETLPQIERDYIKTGKLRYVLKDFPIDAIHPQAMKAHEAARCAGQQDRYWEMRALLLGNPKSLAASDLAAHAASLQLDLASFQLCLNSGKQTGGIEVDLAEGRKAGVNGTPSFFLGVSQANDSEVRVVKAIRGAQPYQSFKEAIEALLVSPPK